MSGCLTQLYIYMRWDVEAGGLAGRLGREDLGISGDFGSSGLEVLGIGCRSSRLLRPETLHRAARKQVASSPKTVGSSFAETGTVLHVLGKFSEG